MGAAKLKIAELEQILKVKMLEERLLVMEQREKLKMEVAANDSVKAAISKDQAVLPSALDGVVLMCLDRFFVFCWGTLEAEARLEEVESHKRQLDEEWERLKEHPKRSSGAGTTMKWEGIPPDQQRRPKT